MRAAGVTHVVLEASSHAIDLSAHPRLLDRCGGVHQPEPGPPRLPRRHARPTGRPSSGSSRSTSSRAPRPGGRWPSSTPTAPTAGSCAGRIERPVIRVGTGAGCSGARRGVSSCEPGRHSRGHPPVRASAFEFALAAGGTPQHRKHPVRGRGRRRPRHPGRRRSAPALKPSASVPGRLERVESSGGRHVYVDYSHTPDALEHALAALRALTAERIICVFGCGGDRDRTKRPLMGAIAARLSDLAIVTSDNPRTEDPQAIIDEILPAAWRRAGDTGAGRTRGSSSNRTGGEAIALALSAPRARGHRPDRRQGARDRIRSSASTSIHFDDREEAAQRAGDAGRTEQDWRPGTTRTSEIRLDSVLSTSASALMNLCPGRLTTY
ncbi:MAG: hypothetical protein MZV70_20160 [Desulfobacterales bacterium]|nr:hypothetical protein [Desulfobacterales bacterium]